MSKFEDVYNNVVLEIKYRNNSKNIHGSIPTYECGVIYEDVAFHKLPRKFSDELIKIVKDMKINKIPEKDIDLRSLFKLIKKSEVENFDQFFNFIQLLILYHTFLQKATAFLFLNLNGIMFLIMDMVPMNLEHIRMTLLKT